MRRLSTAELRSAQLGVLREIDLFCVQHGIRYYLYGGTLLGAVRHDGYIPWDDDIDLMMLRPDYERFCVEFRAAAPGTNFSLHTAGTRNDYPFPFAKIADDRTRLVEDLGITVPIGVNVDIFPLDGWPEGRGATQLHKWRILCYRGIVKVRSIPRRADRFWPKALLLAGAKLIAKRVPLRTLAEWISAAATAYPVDTSTRAGVTVWGVQERVPKEAFGEPAEVTFEGRRYPAPCDYHQVLRRIYGEYMTLPPEADRQTHHAVQAFAL